MSRLQNLKNKNNPTLVYSRTENETEPVRGRIYLVLFFIFIGVLVYLIFFSTIFKISKIEVSGYRDPEMITSLVGDKQRESLINNNLLFINTTALKTAIIGDPKIEEIKIKKILPNKLQINITESTPAMIWNTAGERFLVDGRGVISGLAADEKMPEVFDGANIKSKPGERVASPTFIKFIFDIQKDFEPTTGAKISKITIFDLINDVHVMSSANWTVYLDASKSPEAQLKNLSKVLEEAAKSTKKLEYVDMRLENKIFYK